MKKNNFIISCLIFFFTFQTFAQQSDFEKEKLAVFKGHTIPSDPNILFYLQKNTNPNTIIYALKTGSDGKINKKNPLEVFWRRYQEDGRRKELAWLEKTFAFDFKVKPVEGKNNTYVFTIVAFKKQKFYFTQTKKGDPRVITLINGKTATIERVYLTVDDSTRIQKVISVEVFGRYTKTGAFAYEKLLK